MYGDKISVIIPIYNMQEYLDKCISSVMHQTYDNLEIILVDDGSCDQSLAICRKYQKSDKRIQVIHKENGGLVSARKEGIERATGEYVTFVDADDWIDENAYEKILDGTEEADVIAYGLIEEYGHKQISRRNDFMEGRYEESRLREEVIPKMLYRGNFFEFGILPNLVCKLIKRSLLQSCCRKINNRVTMGEDADFTYHVMLEAKSLYMKDICPYHYIQRTASMVRNEVAADSLKSLFEDLNTADKTGENLQWQRQVHIYMKFLFLLKRTDECVKNDSFFQQFVDKKVIVYGAGNYGQAVSNALERELHTKIIGIADRAWEQLQEGDNRVIAPKDILKKSFDYVYIGILNEDICKKVKEQLVHEGIKEDSILYYDGSRVSLTDIRLILEKG